MSISDAAGQSAKGSHLGATQRMVVARLAIESHVQSLRDEIKARGDIYWRMCDRLHDCCRKYKLGRGGERVDDLVIEEIERLRSGGSL